MGDYKLIDFKCVDSKCDDVCFFYCSEGGTIPPKCLFVNQEHED